MKKVLSKYKNPDKFIEKLKDDIKQYDDWLEDLRKEREVIRGELCFEYSDNVTYDISVSSEDFDEFRIGDEAVMIGEVTSLKATIDDSSITISKGIEIRRRRKL